VSGLFAITLEEQIAEVERELALRHRVYPRWVAAKQLSPAKADRQIATMESVLCTLRSVAGGQK
jgi:hypothetical protein